MNELTNTIAILGRPYTVTRSRLGAITKVYQNRYFCDPAALHELFQAVGEKLSALNHIGTPAFSFLLSFSDQTHHDGVTDDLRELTTIPIGKRTERAVLRWVARHRLDGSDNELSITVRISNQINPLVFLRAALSKSPSELDNVEFEMGSTCVTVDGAGQIYADEIFLLVNKWLAARNKPHAMFNVERLYSKYEWWIDELNATVLPLLLVTILSILVWQYAALPEQVMSIPILLGLYFLLQSLGRTLNFKMARWAKKSMHLSLFALTNGDNDAITKQAASARNSALKLIVSFVGGFVMNVLAGFCVAWVYPG